MGREYIHHEEIIRLVGDLVRAVCEPGDTHLKIYANELVLDCYDASCNLQEAWAAIEARISPDQTQWFLGTLYGLLAQRGRKVSLHTHYGDGCSQPLPDANESIAIDLPPDAMHQVQLFANRVGMDISRAAALLLFSGLQIRSLVFRNEDTPL